MMQIEPPEVIIHFVTKKKISAVHRDYFNDPSPTDCISFPIDHPNEKNPFILGEIFISPKVALEYAREHDLDPYEEASLYLVHALLHLLGYEDTEKEKRIKMKKKEAKIHSYLKEKKSLLYP